VPPYRPRGQTQAGHRNAFRGNRRPTNAIGFDYPLLPPEAALDPFEDAVSISAAMALLDQSAQEFRP